MNDFKHFHEEIKDNMLLPDPSKLFYGKQKKPSEDVNNSSNTFRKMNILKKDT